MAEFRGYEHCPEDVREAIAAYDKAVADGEIRPWNPDTRDEYCDVTAAMDEWVAGHLRQHLPGMSTDAGSS